MKTGIFDLRLRLRWISNAEDAEVALAELDASSGIDRETESLDVDDWNFLRLPDEVAKELAEWQAMGEPSGMSPLKDMTSWLKWREGRS